MNRTIGVMAGLLLALGASACVSDPSLDFAADPNQIAADPDAMFLTYGVQKQVLVRYVDDRNRATPAKFEITNVGPGITVTLDDHYRMDVIGSDTLHFREVQLQHRFFVNSTEAAATGLKTEFTINTAGVSKTIPVYVQPGNLGTGLSTTTPQLGEAVTITAPANLSFDPASSVVSLVEGTTAVAAVVLDQTAESITFVPRVGSSGVVRVTNVTMDYAPTVNPRTLETSSSITLPNAQPALSSQTPDLGDPVTVTAQGGTQFTATSTVTFTPGGQAFISNRTATSLTFIPAPGSEGAATISNVIVAQHDGSELGTFSVTTSNEITDPIPAPDVDEIVGNFSNPSPAAGQTVTFSAPGFKFLPTTRVQFGNRQAAVTAVSPDSTTITVLPPIGASGPATITNAVLDFLVTVPLPATPSSGTLTTPAGYVAPKLANSEALSATTPNPDAPEFALGPANPNVGIFDGGAWTGADWAGGGGPNRMYKMVVTGATLTRQFSIDWAGGADLDLYVENSSGAQAVYLGTTNHPESGSASIAADSYWVVPINWGNTATPDWVFVTVQ